MRGESIRRAANLDLSKHLIAPLIAADPLHRDDLRVPVESLAKGLAQAGQPDLEPVIDSSPSAQLAIDRKQPPVQRARVPGGWSGRAI